MLIRNEAEEAVRAEVESRREARGGESLVCRCPLCLADVSALALSILPPRYTTGGDPTGPAGPGAFNGAVRSAVFTSMKRVARRPKHPRSSPETRAASVRLINFTYEEGASLVASFIRRNDIPCTCRACLADTLAYALNRYPAKYGVLHKGREHLPSHQRAFMREEFSVILLHAARVVASRPRHVPAGS